MSDSLVVAGLALRQLWISFRLLAVVAVFGAAGLVGAVVPLAERSNAPLAWLAGGVGAAALFLAALAAWSFGAERAGGTAAWLVSRSVARSSLLIGWLLALLALAVAALIPVAMLGWLAILAVPAGGTVAPWAYGAAMLATLADLLAALSVGLLAGTLLRGAPAVALAAGAVGSLGLAGFATALDAVALPGDALRLLAELPARERPLADAVGAAGASLVLAALLIAAGLFAIGRSRL